MIRRVVQTSRAILLSAPLLLSSCGGANGMQPAAATCANDSRAQTYLPGMQQMGMGKLFSVKLVKADPGPPVKGLNTWTVEILDANSGPVDGATLGVSPFMPDHGHGPPVKPQVTPMGMGQYKIDRLDLFMSGLWRVTMTVGAGMQNDQMVFAFCIEG